MANNKLVTTLEAVNGGQDFAILVEKSDYFDYENGKKADTRTGVRLTVALQGSGRLKLLTVKFAGKDPLSNVEDSAIVKAVAIRQYPYIRLINCVVTTYAIQGEMVSTATAESAEFIDFSKAK